MATRSCKTGIRYSVLAAALGMCFAGGVQAQSTTGTLLGTAPAGDTVTVTSETGFTRQVTVGSDGRYTVGNLPVGNYTVTLRKGEGVVDTRKVLLRVGSGTEANFGSGAASSSDLGTVTVTGQRNTIDVTQVDSRVVITARELQQLPIGQSAENIALLAPGAIQGAAGIQSKDGRSINTVSFGGAGVTENAYYMNGYNSTDPLGGLGGVGLPYGSIAQQETYIGGYSAMYGRSQGGVLSQVGKRGTNQWHFGGQVRYMPDSLQGKPKDVYFPNPALAASQTVGGTTYSFKLDDASLPGKLYRRGAGSEYSALSYNAYIGGPLIPNTLFFFISAEAAKSQSVSNPTYYDAGESTHTTVYNPKLYAKLDWNINDNNILELTNVRNTENLYRDLYAYNFTTGDEGNKLGKSTTNKISTNVTSGKFTSYLSEDLTLSILYGRSVVHNPRVAANNPLDMPFISGSANQNFGLTGGGRVINAQRNATGASDSGRIYTNGLRVDVNWRLGSHMLSGGIDNMHYEMIDQGRKTLGPGYYWIYYKTTQPTVAVNPALGVGAPNSPYYVGKRIFVEATSSKVDQTAYYVEDAWNVTDRFLLKLGVRNDKFVNRNSAGEPYVTQTNQWAPRIGFSWDISGDSTAKLYGNIGRYFLALPPSVAIRGASASTYTTEYFTYSGINANGVPTGLTAIGPGAVSANKEYGTAPDPRTIASRGLKSQYQDEFILGFDKQLGARWSAGVKGMVRKLRTAIDDYCDYDTLADSMMKRGVDPNKYDVQGCYIFNPGRSNTFYINSATPGGAPILFTASNAELGFKDGPTRNYYGVDFYIDHAFDGKWSGRIDYTWSRNTGNTEGQVKSDTGQGDTSKTSDWDYGALMDYGSGVLQNDRTHQIKMRGAYQFAEEWLLTGAASIMSGRPRNCLGYYGVGEQNPSPGYGVYYHYCGGTPMPPGAAGRTPWTKVFNLGLQYRPTFAQKKLMIGLDVLNAFNERVAMGADPWYNSGRYTVSNTYGMGSSFVTPRRVVFSVSYDY